MKKLLMILALGLVTATGGYAASVVTASITAPAPAYTLLTNVPQAGQPLKVTVNRADVSVPATVVIATKDNTALATTDYDASTVSIIFAVQQSSASILIPTHMTTTKFGQTLKVGIILKNGSTAIASMLASIIEPAAPPVVNWIPAPMVDGGYVRCKTADGCHGIAAPYPAIIAQQGDIAMYKWNGVSYDNRQIAALWPDGQYMTKTPYVGAEGFSDEWEGVAKQ